MSVGSNAISKRLVSAIAGEPTKIVEDSFNQRLPARILPARTSAKHR
jgi:hypothetical protein